MSGLRGITGARTLRFIAVSLLLAAVLVTAAPAPPAAAAGAQADVFVEVNPSTIQAGFQVGVLASCGDDVNPATVTSGAFGEITLNPTSGSNLLQGSATVPTSTRPGQYQVELTCRNGAKASVDLFVLGMAQPTRGPKAGGGGTASAGPGGPVATVLLTGTGVAALAAGAGLVLAYRRRAG